MRLLIATGDPAREHNVIIFNCEWVYFDGAFIITPEHIHVVPHEYLKQY